MDQERRALDLLDVVETGDADVAIREGLGGSLDFGEDFVGVLAAVHRELPHDPVAVVVVARVGIATAGSGVVFGVVAGMGAVTGSSNNRCDKPMRPSGHNTMARCTTLLSSRTLPGHGYCNSALSASGESW